MKQLIDSIKSKANSIIKKKKRSLEKMQQVGLENYLISKIERYSDSPALMAHFRSELQALRE